MIILIVGSKVFHFAISKMIFGIQEANFPYYLDEIHFQPFLELQKLKIGNLDDKDFNRK